MPIVRAVRFSAALLHRTPFWSEVWSALGAVSFGLLVLCSPNDVSERPAFTTLRDYGLGTMFWAWAGLVFGLIQLAALRSTKHGARLLAAALLAGWWLIMALTIVTSDPWAPTFGVVFFTAIGNGVSMLRLNRPGAA